MCGRRRDRSAEAGGGHHLRSSPTDARVRPPWRTRRFPGPLLCAQPRMGQGFPSSQPQQAGRLPGGGGFWLGLVFVTREVVSGSPTDALKAGRWGHPQCLCCPPLSLLRKCQLGVGHRASLPTPFTPSGPRYQPRGRCCRAPGWEVRPPAQEGRRSAARAAAVPVCVCPGRRQPGRQERAVGGSKPGGLCGGPGSRLVEGQQDSGLGRQAGRGGLAGDHSPGRGFPARGRPMPAAQSSWA